MMSRKTANGILTWSGAKMIDHEAKQLSQGRLFSKNHQDKHHQHQSGTLK